MFFVPILLASAFAAGDQLYSLDPTKECLNSRGIPAVVAPEPMEALMIHVRENGDAVAFFHRDESAAKYREHSLSEQGGAPVRINNVVIVGPDTTERDVATIRECLRA